jgi:Proteasome subunit
MQADAKALHKTLQVHMRSCPYHVPAKCYKGAQIHLARLLERQIHGSLIRLLLLQARAVQYQFAHRKPMNVSAAAQLLSNTLYYKRFFPYYTANLCCGLDKDGGC